MKIKSSGAKIPNLLEFLVSNFASILRGLPPEQMHQVVSEIVPRLRRIYRSLPSESLTNFERSEGSNRGNEIGSDQPPSDQQTQPDKSAIPFQEP